MILYCHNLSSILWNGTFDIQAQTQNCRDFHPMQCKWVLWSVGWIIYLIFPLSHVPRQTEVFFNVAELKWYVYFCLFNWRVKGNSRRKHLRTYLCLQEHSIIFIQVSFFIFLSIFQLFAINIRSNVNKRLHLGFCTSHCDSKCEQQSPKNVDISTVRAIWVIDYTIEMT